MLAACLTLGWAAVAGAAWAGEPGKDGSLDDPRDACDRAAAMAEAAWQLPNGLLSAIGIVESGRGDPARARPVPWPWTINFDGHGYFLPDKAEAVQVVGIVRAAGRAVIDVGCFQVNLFYHPDAFTNIADAFDPVSNAQAAARILARARDGGNSWEAAIGLYHSASPDRAAAYLRKVQEVWPWARTPGMMPDAPSVLLLSSSGRPIQVLKASDIPISRAEDLPRVVGPQTATGVLQWAASAPVALPVVLTPPAGTARLSPRWANGTRWNASPLGGPPVALIPPSNSPRLTPVSASASRWPASPFGERSVALIPPNEPPKLVPVSESAPRWAASSPPLRPVVPPSPHVTPRRYTARRSRD